MPLPVSILNQADQVLHSLAQLIALTGMQWLPAHADDSHTNIVWNRELHRLEARPFTHSGRLVKLVINTDAFALKFIDDREHIFASFLPVNRTPADAMAWWKSQMQAWGVSDIRELNYQLERNPIALLAPYERPESLADWGYWRTVANAVLSSLTEQHGQRSEVSIWPHHFDTGVYYAVPDANGQERGAIWAGYAIADAICEEPYFYISGYNGEKALDFANTPPLTVGEWLNGPAWKGALLPISAITETNVVDVFLREGYDWLGHSMR